MSSTSNAQDLLVNVFRPTYRWDSNTGFVPSLTISNVSEIITGSIKTDLLVVSDTGNNTYIGSNAGLYASNTAYNVGLGYQAMGGAINSSNNVAVGYYALDGAKNSTSNVVLGSYSGLTNSNGGVRNVLIGPNVTVGTGSGNILIGADISLASGTNRFQLGKLLYGDLSSGYIGVNTDDPKSAFDVSGTTLIRGKLGIQTVPNPKYSLDVNGSIFANDRFFGGRGTVAEPVYSFDDVSASGMYVPQASEGYGNGAFAIAVNQKPAAIFSSNAVNFFQNLDVSGTFSACNVELAAFSVEAGSRTAPTITFASNRADGFYHLADTSGFVAVTMGQDRMMFLQSGDISSSRILGSDISLAGAIFTTAGCNVVGGVTLCNGNVILTGTATNSNLLVPGWFRNNETVPTVDISGGVVRAVRFRAQDGSAGTPAYSFLNDASSGMRLITRGAIAFDTSGTQRMCISAGFVGIGTANPRVALEVVGDVSATTYNGPGGTALLPHYTFSDDRTTGVFFPGANMVGFTAGGRERMRISNGFVAIGTTVDPSSALDISGVFRIIGRNGNITFDNGTIDVSGTPLVSTTGAFSNAATTSNVIGGVTLSNGFTQSGTFRGSNGSATVPTYSFISDPSTGFHRSGVSQIAFDTSGVQRMCISGGFVGIATATPATALDVSGTTRSINFSGLNGSATIPTYSFTNDPSTGLHWSGVSQLAFDTSGVQRMCISGGFVGIATATPATALDVSGTVRSINFRGLNGSATVPTYGFTNDPSTGLHWSGVSQLAFDTSGVQRMCISGGFVGIATATPATALDVSGTTRSINFRGLNGSATIPTYGFTNDPSTGLHWAGVSQLAFDTSGVQRMCISGGFVGIGTSNPIWGLDVSGSGVQKIQVSGQDAAINVWDQRVADPAVLFQNASNYGIYSSNALPFWLWQSNAVRMCISAGRVGIATQTPDSQLHVANSSTDTNASNIFIMSTGDIKKGQSNEIQFRSRDVNGTVHLTSIRGIDIATGSDPYRGDLAFLTTQAANQTLERMRIRWNGNVGIGTPAPLGLLDVSGSIRVGCITGNELSTNAGTIEIGGGLNGRGEGGLPAIAFQGRDGASPMGWGWRHFIQTVHSGGVATTGNAIRFFICSGSPGGSDPTLSSAPGVGNLPVMSITQQGVGIGTVDPTEILDISTSRTYGIQLRNPAPAGNIGLRLSNGFGATGDFGLAGGNGSWTGGALAGDTVIRASCNFHVQTKGCNRMSITETGVGIGTWVPVGGFDISHWSTTIASVRITNVPLPTQTWGGTNRHVVDISGGMRIVQDASLVGPLNNDPRSLFDSLTLQSSRGQGSNGTASIMFRSGLDNAYYGRIFGVDRGTPAGAYIGDLVFQTSSSSGNLPEVMRLTWDERVGIGTAAPGYKLDVAGVINTTSNFRVARNNFIIRSGPVKGSGASTYGVTWGTSEITPNASSLITYTVDSVNGDTFAVSSNGMFTITFSANQGALWTVDADVVATSISSAGSASAGLVGWTYSVGGAIPNGGTFSGWLQSGKTYRLKCSGALQSGTNCKLYIAPIYATA